MTRIVMKVVTKAKKDCHSPTKPSNNGTPEDTPGDRNDGSRRFRTSNVMAKAKTPSLKPPSWRCPSPRDSRRFPWAGFEGTHRVDLKVPPDGPTGSKSCECSVRLWP